MIPFFVYEAKMSIVESIIDITKQRDSDAFGVSIVTTIAEMLPNSVVVLYQNFEYPFRHFETVCTLLIKQDELGLDQYIWDVETPEVTTDYVSANINKLIKLTVYQTDDGMYHTFIPIFCEQKASYGIDISSKERLSQKLDGLLAISRVCENFYTILATSEKDTLTGLFNRRTYELKINALLNRQYFKQRGFNKKSKSNKRYLVKQEHTWLALIDIDLFKKVNDQVGHIYGDEVLLTLSQLMNKSFRSNDLLFRFGGEEFIVVLEPITRIQAFNVLDAFRKKVEAHHFPLIGNITISCGFAKISDKDHSSTVLDHADKAMYYAKENGRNSIWNYEHLIEKSLIIDKDNEGEIQLF